MIKIYILASIEINDLEKKHLQELGVALTDNSQTQEKHFHSLRGYKGLYVANIPNTGFKGRFIFKKLANNELLLVALDTKHSYNRNNLKRLESLDIQDVQIKNLDNEPVQQFTTPEAANVTNEELTPVWKNKIEAKLIKGKIIALTQTQYEVVQNIYNFILGKEYRKFGLVEGVAGSGKTLIIIDAIISLTDITERITDKKILYLSPTSELLDKVSQEIKEAIQGDIPDFVVLTTFEQATQKWAELDDDAKRKFCIIKDECQRDFSVLPGADSYLYIGDDNQVSADSKQDPDFLNKVFDAFFQEFVSQYCKDTRFADDVNKIIQEKSDALTKLFSNQKMTNITEYILNPEKFTILMQNFYNDTVLTYLNDEQKLSNIRQAISVCIKITFMKTFLPVSIRCPQDVTNLAESLLKLRTNTAGRKLKSGILLRNNQVNSTEVRTNNIYTAELNSFSRRSVEDAHIVFDETTKAQLIEKGFFNVFSAYECSGLEYKNICLHTRAGTINKTQDSDKTLIAQLYTAMTRSTSTLILDSSFAHEKHTDPINRVIATVLESRDHSQLKIQNFNKQNSQQELFAHAIILSKEKQTDQLDQIVTVMLKGKTELIKTIVDNIKIITNENTTKLAKIQALQVINAKIAIDLKTYFIEIISSCSTDELKQIIPVLFQNIKLLISILEATLPEKYENILSELPYQNKAAILYNNDYYTKNTESFNKLFASLSKEEKLNLLLSAPTETSRHIFTHNYYKDQDIAKELIKKAAQGQINNLVLVLLSVTACTLYQIDTWSHQEEYKEKLAKFAKFTDNLQLANIRKLIKQEYASSLLHKIESVNDLKLLISTMVEINIYNIEDFYKEISDIEDETRKNKCKSILLEKIFSNTNLDIEKDYLKELLFSVEFSAVKKIIKSLLAANKHNLVYQLSNYFNDDNRADQASEISKLIISSLQKYFSDKTINKTAKNTHYTNLNDDLKTICARHGFAVPILVDDFAKLESAFINNNFTEIHLLLNNNKKLFTYKALIKKSYDTKIFMIAAKNGYIHTLKLILNYTEANFDINTKLNNNFTALMLAAGNGHNNVVELLLGRNDIDINAKSTKNFTALMLTANLGHTNVVKTLLEHKKIDINAKSTKNFTAFMLAAQNGHISVVELLLGRNDIDINAKSTKNFTSFMLAAQNGHTSIVELLLERNDIDINAKSTNNFTAFMLAAQNGHTGVVKLLLGRNDIEINEKSKANYTALMLAAENGHTDVVKVLLEHKDKVDINTKSNEGCTALNLATRYGYTEIERMIEKITANRTHTEQVTRDRNQGKIEDIRINKILCFNENISRQ